MQAPYPDCQFRECDLPGQCASEGRCHHPGAENPQPCQSAVRAPCPHCHSNYPMHDLSCPISVERMKRAAVDTDAETLQRAARAAHALGPISMAQVECIARIVQAAKPAPHLWPVTDKSGIGAVYDVSSIGRAANTARTLLANVESAIRRSQCLSAIERHFFTTEVPDNDIPGLTVGDCPLNWGASPDEYVKQFRAALAGYQAEPRPKHGEQAQTIADFASAVIREMAELPDRNSPDDDPEAMLANADEVRGCIERALEHTGFRIAPGALRNALRRVGDPA